MAFALNQSYEKFRWELPRATLAVRVTKTGKFEQMYRDHGNEFVRLIHNDFVSCTSKLNLILTTAQLHLSSNGTSVSRRSARP